MAALSRERWQVVSPLLDRVLDIAPDEREAWIATLRADDPTLAADLQDLLQEHAEARREGFLEDAPPVAPPPASLAGLDLGPWALVSPIGQGGMGSVWLARRSDGRFEGRAAVKLLNVGLIGRGGGARFRREGTILARLRHPYIAHLIDAGLSSAGQPYLVLEHVDGQRIDVHCDAARLGIEARIRLFLDVADAVAHAHANLIVHRDLKPSNVLVTRDGQVKLLDFGIAKLLEPEAPGQATALTREGGGALTPEYAAPEQVTGGAVTTATDVYALGVLLYLLLGGRHPAGDTRRPPADLFKAILDSEPPRLSDAARAAGAGPDADAIAARRASTPDRLRRVLRGDLDTIVAKALKKDPQERYPSVTALADDLRRFLNHEPIRARPDSLSYRGAKFVRRHRLPVALALLAAAAAVAGMAGTISQARRATRQAALAGAQAARAEAVRDFLFTVFKEAEPGVPGRQPPSVRDLVKDAVRAARADAGMQALARVELLTELGRVLGAQGEVAAAREVLEETFRDAERRLGRDSEPTLFAGRALAEALSLAGEQAQARALVDDILRRAPARMVSLRGQALMLSSYLHSLRLEGDAALPPAREAVELCRQACPQDELANALTVLASAQHTLNQLEASVATWEEVLELERKRYGPSHLRVANALAGLSRALTRLGRLERAEESARQALAIDEAVLGPDDWRRYNHLNALLIALRARRDYPAALQAARDALRIARAAHGDEHPEVAGALSATGVLLTVSGEYREAAALLKQALALREKTDGPEGLQTAIVRGNYGDALARSGDPARGEAELRHALASQRQARSRDPEGECTKLEKLGRVHLDSGNSRAALAEFEEIRRVAEGLGARGARWKARAALGRGRALLLLGRLDEAAAELEEARASQPASADPEQAAEIQLARVLVLRRLVRSDDSRKAADAARSSLASLAHPPARLSAFAEQVWRTPPPPRPPPQ
jgi:eukaryotic-like serine/threonine-protein kinase